MGVEERDYRPYALPSVATLRKWLHCGWCGAGSECPLAEEVAPHGSQAYIATWLEKRRIPQFPYFLMMRL